MHRAFTKCTPAGLGVSRRTHTVGASSSPRALVLMKVGPGISVAMRKEKEEPQLLTGLVPHQLGLRLRAEDSTEQGSVSVCVCVKSL